MKVLSSLLIALLGITYLAVSLGGGFMRGFGASGALDPYDSVQILMNGTVLVATLLVVAALWCSSRSLLVIGGLLLVLPVIIGFVCLTIPPLGLAILTPPILWYFAAYSKWEDLGSKANKSQEKPAS